MSEERQADVQALSTTDTRVYEAVAVLAVDTRTANVEEIVHATGLPEQAVRHSVETLTKAGWLTADGGSYAIGRHDWSVER
ncbi:MULTISPECIES: hypothetical protein [Streptosporangium]|uniref:MarR family transcriptional regulator n=1 Tax=Streptosporangium jomthongense TaxID=1193683 RepID=A0ABV8F2V0_9ACTN